jgi:hypothetical protein
VNAFLELFTAIIAGGDLNSASSVIVLEIAAQDVVAATSVSEVEIGLA